MTTGDELAQLRTRHQLILDSAGEGIYGLNRDGKITFSNAAATAILGWKLEDVFGKVAHEVHHHSHADGSTYARHDCPIYAALADGEMHHVDDEVFWHIDGSSVPVEYTSTPIMNNGQVIGAVVIFRDISDRKRIELEREAAHAEIVRLQKAQQLILNAAGEGIYGLDANGRITFGNAATSEIVGWKAEDLHGQQSHDVHHHSHEDGSEYPIEECPIYAALCDGEVHRVDDEVFWHTNGQPVPVEYTSTPILKDGKPNGAVVVFRDISERKRIEREREEAYEEVKRLKEQLEQQRDYLRDEIDVTIHFGEIIGRSTALMRTLEKVNAVAKTSANVLIHGESGVGKEMIARAIHSESERSDRPLIKVNCASIPKELFESEFFGHVRGAFTGAYKNRVGRLQLAHEGTLFLDEIGEIPLDLQGKLLRALQEKEFERVGDDTTMRVDVRVVAATNKDLEKEVESARFREDLYYRLSVFPVEIPSLRDRVDDIPLLAMHFLKQICRELGRDIPKITKQQMAILQAQPWPGNIRELRNVLERAAILTKGTRLRLDIALGVSHKENQRIQPAPEASSTYLTDAEFRETEKRNLIAAMRAANWRVWGPNGAAALLGIKPSTLAYRINAFKIRRGNQD